ncbi:adenylate/guanylate cyclase [Ginsengibacter hankyongi]|uniref:Adenylate/guanylate cyclase n=1 Tax=Ginsengibacter hankyongi TaxID=2607284 RepID=A0A5J5IM50_9BACT|nr:adenylate/guanylate cyclase domain-containing protein [Ginsengibacter hankyongi]KAA9042100.1 adenylate/guanylate cyclase [Ginsengibacter hankyongi]
MARVTLKSILSKKNDVSPLVNSLIEQMNAHISIEDESGILLCGNTEILTANNLPVIINDEAIGWVKGDENATHIAGLLTLLAQREFERKSLGSEVLLLYQEVNMVFNFSDKLAQAIGPVAISQLAVDEAMHLIHSNSGLVVLWDEATMQLQIPATAGEPLFDQEKISSHADLLLRIGLSGQSEIMSDLSSLREEGIIGPGVHSLIYSALKVKHRIMGAIILAGNKQMQYAASDLKFLTTLALQSSSAIESALLHEKNLKEAREREEAMRRVYEITAKFVPYEFIGSLGHNFITDVKLGDQVEKVVTVLFTDIRDYTSLSEQMTPEENFRFVNAYNERMGPIIRKHDGFINQYLGDAIMALFPESAEHTLSAAIEMQQNIREFNVIRKFQNLPPIKMGIGMHTGPLIMGITGDKNRLDATTISDAVNTASRIESLTKYYKVRILLSEVTLQQIQHPEIFHLRYLGRVQVKGKQSSIGIHECFSSDSEDQVFKKEKTLAAFNEGMDHYLNKSFDNAVKVFRSITDINPTDLTTQFFLDNSRSFLQNGTPQHWSGVVEMANK